MYLNRNRLSVAFLSHSVEIKSRDFVLIFSMYCSVCLLSLIIILFSVGRYFMKAFKHSNLVQQKNYLSFA